MKTKTNKLLRTPATIAKEKQMTRTAMANHNNTRFECVSDRTACLQVWIQFDGDHLVMVAHKFSQLKLTIAQCLWMSLTIPVFSCQQHLSGLVSMAWTKPSDVSTSCSLELQEENGGLRGRENTHVTYLHIPTVSLQTILQQFFKSNARQGPYQKLLAGSQPNLLEACDLPLQREPRGLQLLQ